MPFISNEANVFVTFERKARAIQDHLETTAAYYRGKTVVVQGSATQLDYLPDESVDLIFTNPPFGANINYSEMNLLWEAWLQRFTDTTKEAIVNSVQGKGVADYQRLMTASLRECYRVVRPGHWLLLVFMNSSTTIWSALQCAIQDAGFQMCQADIFDKQHGTFKQFVSENTAGCDLVLHCLKPTGATTLIQRPTANETDASVLAFLAGVNLDKPINVFLHVDRAAELDVRKLYSEWTARAILNGVDTLDFARFRALVYRWIATSPSRR